MIQARVGGKFLGYLDCEPERLAGIDKSLLNLGGHAYSAPVRYRTERFSFKPTDTLAERHDELKRRNMPRRATALDRWRSPNYGGGDEHAFEFQYADLEEDTAFLLFVRDLVEESDS